MWAGLTDEGHEGNWAFTDGTTLPEGVTLDIQNGASNENCGFLFPGGIDDYKCWKKLPYLCMAKGNCLKYNTCKVNKLNIINSRRYVNA